MRPSPCGLATMESNNGMLRGTGRVVEADIAASLVLAVPASAQKTVWNHNVFGPPRAVTVGIETIRDVLQAASHGNFELKIAYGAALGPVRKIARSPRSGRLNAEEATSIPRAILARTPVTCCRLVNLRVVWPAEWHPCMPIRCRSDRSRAPR
jgi:hypothetical protein